MLSSHHQILIQTNNDSKFHSKLPIIHYMPEKNKPLFNYLNYPHGIQAQLKANNLLNHRPLVYVAYQVTTFSMSCYRATNTAVSSDDQSSKLLKQHLLIRNENVSIDGMSEF